MEVLSHGFTGEGVRRCMVGRVSTGGRTWRAPCPAREGSKVDQDLIGGLDLAFPNGLWGKAAADQAALKIGMAMSFDTAILGQPMRTASSSSWHKAATYQDQEDSLQSMLLDSPEFAWDGSPANSGSNNLFDCIMEEYLHQQGRTTCGSALEIVAPSARTTIAKKKATPTCSKAKRRRSFDDHDLHHTLRMAVARIICPTSIPERDCLDSALKCYHNITSDEALSLHLRCDFQGMRVSSLGPRNRACLDLCQLANC